MMYGDYGHQQQYCLREQNMYALLWFSVEGTILNGS